MNNQIPRTIQSAVVTGPTGAVGIALCQELLKEGMKVYAVCRPKSPRIRQLLSFVSSERLHVLECELSQLDSLPEQIFRYEPAGEKYVDLFYHLGWTHTTGDGRNAMEAQVQNIRYALDAVHAAKRLGCKVFIGAGSQAEYGRCEKALAPDTPAFPETGYGMAKLCAGQMSRAECHKLGMEHIWTRILSVYGPGDGEQSMISVVIRKLKEGKVPSLTAGDQLWDYLYSGDAARALYLMALYGRDGAVYPLGSGQAKPLRDYIRILRDQIAPEMSLGFGKLPYTPGQIMFLQADLTRLYEDTGFIPGVSFEEGIRKTIEWFG